MGPIVFLGKLYHSAYRYLGSAKQGVLTEWNVANWVGWDEASRFGFDFRGAGVKAKRERNETAGWH